MGPPLRADPKDALLTSGKGGSGRGVRGRGASNGSAQNRANLYAKRSSGSRSGHGGVWLQQRANGAHHHGNTERDFSK